MKKKWYKDIAENIVIIILSLIICISFMCFMGGLVMGPAIAAITMENNYYALLYLITGPIFGLIISVLDSWK